MPLRSMGYDVRQYEKEAAKIKKALRDKTKLSEAEYLSGFAKENKLHPCITFVLYYGDNWDGSKDLYGLLDFTDIPAEFRHWVNNYRINLVEIKNLENTDVFHTDIKQVFNLIKNAEDKDNLKKLIENDKVYGRMESDAYDVAMAFVKGADKMGIQKEKYEKDGKFDMCKGLKDWMEEEREGGRAEGKAEGALIALFALVKDGDITLEVAARKADMTVEEFQAKASALER